MYSILGILLRLDFKLLVLDKYYPDCAKALIRYRYRIQIFIMLKITIIFKILRLTG